MYNFIGYVPQDTVLFNDTVKNNITFGEDKVNDLKLGKVFEMTKLSDFINDLPEGAETSLGERGINISGGQLTLTSKTDEAQAISLTTNVGTTETI